MVRILMLHPMYSIVDINFCFEFDAFEILKQYFTCIDKENVTKTVLETRIRRSCVIRTHDIPCRTQKSFSLYAATLWN